LVAPPRIAVVVGGEADGARDPAEQRRHEVRGARRDQLLRAVATASGEILDDLRADEDVQRAHHRDAERAQHDPRQRGRESRQDGHADDLPDLVAVGNRDRDVAQRGTEHRAQSRDAEHVIEDRAADQAQHQRRHALGDAACLEHEDQRGRRDQHAERPRLRQRRRPIGKRRAFREPEDHVKLREHDDEGCGVLESRHHRRRNELHDLGETREAEDELEGAGQRKQQEDRRSDGVRIAGQPIGVQVEVRGDRRDHEGDEAARGVDRHAARAHEHGDEAEECRRVERRQHAAACELRSERREREHAQAHGQWKRHDGAQHGAHEVAA
jgi:hypothetical protein